MNHQKGLIKSLTILIVVRMIYWGIHLKEEIQMYNYGYNCYTPCYSGGNNTGGCGGFAFILVLFILLAIICSCGGFGFGNGNNGCGC